MSFYLFQNPPAGGNSLWIKNIQDCLSTTAPDRVAPLTPWTKSSRRGMSHRNCPLERGARAHICCYLILIETNRYLYDLLGINVGLSFLLYRPDIPKSELIIPKMDSSVMQVTFPTCPNRGSTSPSRSRRVKTRHRKPGKGSSGDLAGLKANQPSPNRDTTVQTNSSTNNTSNQLLEPSAALRGLGHEQQQRQLSSSSPDLICNTLEADGQGKREPPVSGRERGGSLGASPGLGVSEGGAAGLDDLTETPPRSDTPSEDAASFPFSSSPDSPCGKGAAAGRGSLGSPRLPHDGEDKEDGAGAVRLPRGASGGIGSQHLTPSAILYRAAITRKQVLPWMSTHFFSLPDDTLKITLNHFFCIGI